MTHTDIKPEGWIARLPESWRPYALLMRLDRPVGWWLLLIPSLWGIVLAAGGLTTMTGSDVFLIIYFFLGSVMMRGTGCIINDIWDRDIDKQVERTKLRPLAAGTIQVWQAVILLFILLFLSLILLLQMPSVTVKLGFFSILLVAVYPYMKRITWWPQAFLGITFNMGALMGFGAVAADIEWPAVLLYLGCIFWTIGYDTVYAHQDKGDDALVGIKSTALLFGSRSKFLVGACYFLSYALLFAALAFSKSNALALSFMVIPGAHLAWQVIKWDMDDPQNSLSIFQSNRDFGFLILIVYALNSF